MPLRKKIKMNIIILSYNKKYFHFLLIIVHNYRHKKLDLKHNIVITLAYKISREIPKKKMIVLKHNSYKI